MSDVWTTGGAAGEEAVTEDLEWAVRALRDAAGDVGIAELALRTARACEPYPTALGDDLLALAGRSEMLADDLGDVARRLAALVAAYVEAERAARQRLWLGTRVGEGAADAVGRVGWFARVAAGVAALASPPVAVAAALGGPHPLPGDLPPTTGGLNRDSAEAALAHLPGYGAIAQALAAALWVIERLAGEPLPTSVAATAVGRAAATGVEAQMRRIAAVQDHGDGSVEIDRWRGPDGVTRRVVYIPGTEDWLVFSGNPADAQADAAAVTGGLPDAARTVLAALDADGARPGEPVMLVGHSQGGIIAAALAASPAVAARFTVTSIVTAGSPTGRIELPRAVHALHLEGTRDIVPGLDGAPNPDTPTRVTVHHDARRAPAGTEPARSILTAHEIPTYAGTGRLVDAGLSDSTRVWQRQAAPFLTPGDVTTTRYSPAS